MTGQSAIPGLEQELSPLQAEEHIRVESGRCPKCGKGGRDDEPCTGATPEQLNWARWFITVYGQQAISLRGRRRGWSFATTMPDSPHEYAVRERAARIFRPANHGRATTFETETLEADFELFVLLIRVCGYAGKHGRTKYTYLNVRHDDGVVWRYWTMGNPLAETTIINRTPVQTEEQVKLRAVNVKAK